MDVGVRSETKNVFNCGGYPVDWWSQRSVALLSLFLSVYTDPSLSSFFPLPLVSRLPSHCLFFNSKIIETRFQDKSGHRIINQIFQSIDKFTYQCFLL